MTEKVWIKWETTPGTLTGHIRTTKLKELSGEDLDQFIETADLKEMKKSINVIHTPDEQLQALGFIRNIISENKINVLINNDLIPPLINCLRSYNTTQVQYEAISATRSISEGTYNHKNQLISAGAVPRLIQLLSSTESNILEESLLTLNNIATGSSNLRNIVIGSGLLKSLTVFIKKTISKPFLKIISNLYLTICSYKSAPLSKANANQVLPILYNLLDSEEEYIAHNVIESLYYLQSDHQQIIIENGFVQKLLVLFAAPSTFVRRMAIAIVQQIEINTKSQKRALLNSEILASFTDLLFSKNKKTKRNTLCFISKIIINNPAQIKALLDANLIPIIVQNVKEDDERMQNIVSLIILNITESGTRTHILAISGEYSQYLKNIKIRSLELQLLQRTLQIILNIMNRARERRPEVIHMIEEPNMRNSLEILKNHQNAKIRKLAIMILHFIPKNLQKKKL